jgi:hypothetical protein
MELNQVKRMVGQYHLYMKEFGKMLGDGLKKGGSTPSLPNF